MSGNTSATGGYLQRTNAPVTQAQLEDAVQSLIQGVTGIPPDLIRPRWQPEPPNQPPAGTDWAAFGIIERETTGFPYISHANGGSSTLYRWPILSLMVSVYGPNAEDNAEDLRDACYIAQNFEQLNLLGIRLIEAGSVTMVPDLINVQYINRADMRIRLATEQTRTYAIKDIVSADGTITADTGVSGQWLATDPNPSPGG